MKRVLFGVGIRFRLILMGIVLFLLFILQMFFACNSYAAADPTITINLTSLMELDLMPNSFDSATQTIQVSTNNYTGYTASLNNPDGGTDLVNTTDNSLAIPTITLPVGDSSITSSAFVSGYGISLDGTNYVPAPSVNNGLLIGSTSVSGNGSHSLTFGARVSPDVEAGSYSKTFVVVAVANNPQYSISYNANTVDTVSNMPSNIPVTIVSTSTVAISNNVPTRSGYICIGWDEDDTATTPTYGIGDSINLDATTSNTIVLYAIWKPTHTITYTDLTDNNFPSEIIDGGTILITTIDADIAGFNIEMGGVALVAGTDYTYTNNVLTIPNVTDDVTIAAIITPPVVVDYSETFENAVGPSASVTTQLNNMSPSDFVTKIFEYTNNTGRTIAAITVEIVYSKPNQGATSGYLIGHLDYNGNTYNASPVSIPRSRVTNQTQEIATFTNLNIPSSSNVKFRIGTDSDEFTAGITISSQTVTVTFAD